MSKLTEARRYLKDAEDKLNLAMLSLRHSELSSSKLRTLHTEAYNIYLATIKLKQTITSIRVCSHEWVDCSNEVIQPPAELCLKCGAVR